MQPYLASRAVAAGLGGLLLADCVLLAAGLLFATAHSERSLERSADRLRAWLRCIGHGMLLVLLGVALAANTLAVVLGVWPQMNQQPWLAAAVLLLLGCAGGPALHPPLRHVALVALAMAAVLMPVLGVAGWTPCAFAAVAAGVTIAEGGYRAGPLARRLAAPDGGP